MADPLALTDNGKTKFVKNHLNTFGLNYGLPENGGTCPGATLGKGGCLEIRDGKLRPTCYMSKITQIYKAVGNRLQANTSLLKNKSIDEMVEVLSATVAEFIKKNKNQNLYFRLHYSGDFFSEDYAQAWAITINKFPQVQFWAYTRTHEYAKYFTEMKNFTLFLSVDPVNYEKAERIYAQYEHLPHIALAWMGPNAPDQASRRWVSCPEASGKLKNTPEKGACSTCRLCVDNYRNKVKNIKFELH